MRSVAFQGLSRTFSGNKPLSGCRSSEGSCTAPLFVVSVSAVSPILSGLGSPQLPHGLDPIPTCGVTLFGTILLDRPL